MYIDVLEKCAIFWTTLYLYFFGASECIQGSTTLPVVANTLNHFSKFIKYNMS